MTMLSRNPSPSPNGDLPEKLSVEEYLNSRGVSEFGTVYRGEFFSSVEVESLMKRDEADAATHRKLKFMEFIVKDIAVYAAGIILIFTLGGISFNILRQTTSSPADKEWAQETLFTLGVTIAGYVFGRSSKTLQHK